MIKKIFIIFVFAALFAACGNSNKNTTGDNNEMDTIQGPVTITVNDFLTKAEEFVGKEIKIQGTVSHVCKHGGKRMFVFDDNEDNRVKIEASENVASFDASLEGSDVLVSGILKELVIDEAYLAEWEMEVNDEANNPEEKADTTEVAVHENSGLGEAADQGEHVSALESIAEYRNQIKESGKDHLSFYSVECLAYEIMPSDTLK
jgi:hypothetical protein